MAFILRPYFRRFLLFLAFIGFAGSLFSQNPKLNRLYVKLEKARTDTEKVLAMDSLFDYYEKVNPIRALSYAQEALDISTAIKYDKGLMISYENLAGHAADSYDYAGAMEYYLKSLEIAERRNDIDRLGVLYGHMGIILSYQGKKEDSKKYFEKCLAIYKKKNNRTRIAVCYNNLGIANKELKDYDKALDYYAKAMEIFKEKKYKQGIASALNNIGIIEALQGKSDSALTCYRQAQKLYQEINDSSMASGIYVNIGEVYMNKKDYKAALEYYKIGETMSLKSGNKNFQKDAFEGLAECYQAMGRYKEALEYFKQCQVLRDSIRRDDGLQQLHDLERKNAMLNAEKEMDKLKHRQKLESQAQVEQIKRSRAILVAALIILLIVSSLLYFLFRSNQKVNLTNKELAEKKKEIQDSIVYARNIQEAMLSEVDLLKKYFPEGFGFFQPKDVVSGDFYWFNELNDTIYLAVADCTGHGVPGGFMSMIGMDKLNQILIDKQITRPTDILHALNISIKNALKHKERAEEHRSELAVKDGMDIALCHLDLKNNKLTYAGANRPLWIIRDGELMEFSPTKAAIGGHTEYGQVYQEQEIPVRKGDCIYLTSDGYADQFGGPNRKKLMTRELKRYLVQIHQEHMSEQERLLADRFKRWKGSLEQVDDVLVFGVRLG